jgi:hypothetical protein
LQAINERIKQQDWEDAKVRVSNVDSQGSDQNIVIQVIGEISNRSQPHRRFTQTFVLAAQTNGFFVLNDIFRFLRDEEELEGEELKDESVAEAGVEEPAAEDAATEDVPEVVNDEKTVEEVDHKLEEIQQEESEAAAAPAAVNGTTAAEAPITEAEDAPVAAVAVPEPSKAAAEPAIKTAEKPEKPKEPAPTPSAPAKATPAAPPKPAVPKTWATLVAANNKSAAAAAAAAAAATPAAQPTATPAKPTAAAPSATPATGLTTPAAAAPARQGSPANSQGEGWQTAGADNNKRQSRAQPQASAPESQGNRAYIKNVYESVDGDALKKALSKYGELAYFDISRQKVR